jgi:hypothetical protein
MNVTTYPSTSLHSPYKLWPIQSVVSGSGDVVFAAHHILPTADERAAIPKQWYAISGAFSRSSVHFSATPDRLTAAPEPSPGHRSTAPAGKKK